MEGKKREKERKTDRERERDSKAATCASRTSGSGLQVKVPSSRAQKGGERERGRAYSSFGVTLPVNSQKLLHPGCRSRTDIRRAKLITVRVFVTRQGTGNLLQHSPVK